MQHEYFITKIKVLVNKKIMFYFNITIISLKIFFSFSPMSSITFLLK